jgi:hypothetical protein
VGIVEAELVQWKARARGIAVEVSLAD